MKSIPNRFCLHIFALLLAGAMMPFAMAAEPTISRANQPDLPVVAQGVPMGGRLRVTDLNLEQFGVVDLELERFTVFATDAKILIDGQAPVSAPNNAYFRGSINGLPDAIVVLTVPEQGKMRGIITDKTGVWRLAGSSGRTAPGLVNRKLAEDEIASLPPFICNTDKLPINIGNFVGGTSKSASSDTAALPGNVTHTARVAVETDYEYYAKFGNVTNATNYTGDLFAYISTVYEQQANTNLVISFFRLWTGGAASDPWTVTSNTLNALNEYTAYWNANMGAEVRTIGHMLSGKILGGGIAYVGALCNASFGYGLSADLDGNFDINSPSVVWDIVVVSHEIGHNFNSPHTQDYCNIGGNASPVDLCYNSAASCGSALGLPGVGSLSGGVTADRPGTIMSYCHLVSGGMSNISFTFGKDHIYGIAADRVPTRMYDHVLNVASSNPSCLLLGDQYEPDDTSGQASTIQNGSAQDHSIFPVGDVDWVTFTLVNPADIVLETSGPSGNTRLFLYEDDATTQIDFDDDSGSGFFSRISRALPAGTYFAKVDEFSGTNEIAAYSLLLTTPTSGMAVSGSFCEAANLNQALQGIGWSQAGVKNNATTSFFVVCGLPADFNSINFNSVSAVGVFPGSTGQIECTLRTQDAATGSFTTNSAFTITSGSIGPNRGSAGANTTVSVPVANTNFVCALDPGEGIEGYWASSATLP